MATRQPRRNPSRNPSLQPHDSREPTPEPRIPTPIAEEPENPLPEQAQRSHSPTPDPPQFPLPHTPVPNPDYGQHQGTPFEEAPNLAVALMLITEELRRRDRPAPVSAPAPKRAKAKDPDTFDGSDPKKLNNFILLCNLYFRTNPSYDDDATKVNFALSYLRGMALEYFEPIILDSNETPDWMDNWSAFVRTLRTEFGPIDPTADAEDSIDSLKMQDNQHIIKYNVEFTRLAIRTGWDDSVLRHRYYSGLAERIKDIMGQQGKPQTLEDMKFMAHSIDARYWERQREKSRAGKSKADGKPDKPDHKPDNHKSDDKKGSTSNNQHSNKNKKDKQKADNKPASSSSGHSASLADKLGKDGKLTHTERQRCFDNHLCMFCGGVGHTAKDCPKSSSSASKAKARAAQVKEKETPDPKKG